MVQFCGRYVLLISYNKIFLMFPLIIIIYFTCVNSNGASNIPRVAIIGGGMGGTTAAYELTQIALGHDLDIDIHLYEPGNIGGRLATSVVKGFEFETGGSIIHNENLYMNAYVDNFNFSKVIYSDSGSNRCTSISGFYDGNEFVYVDSHYEIVSHLKLWWRYGSDIINIFRDFVRPLLDKFKKIYELQSEKRTFESIHGFLDKLDSKFPGYLKTSLKEMLIKEGYKEKFIEEFIFLATNVNYNQNADIHAFVGGVALAGASAALWSVRGGNKRVSEELLKRSDAVYVNRAVQSVSLTPDGKYALEVGSETEIYDFVIVACPIADNMKQQITFKNFPMPIRVPVSYQRTVTTLVRGVLNHRYFHYETSEGLPNSIYSVDQSLFFNSVSVLNPVNPDPAYKCDVYKVFSKSKLTKEELDSLFSSYDDVTVIDWLAYPLYNTVDANLSFELHENLFHTSAIEWAASAMEMSAIAGHNAAFQVMDRLREKPGGW